MDVADLFEEYASYCTYLLRRSLEPARRSLIEREREEWLVLAYQRRLTDVPGNASQSGDDWLRP